MCICFIHWQGAVHQRQVKERHGRRWLNKSIITHSWNRLNMLTETIGNMLKETKIETPNLYGAEQKHVGTVLCHISFLDFPLRQASDTSDL